MLGGLAQTFATLVAARALQGVFGALLAPAALSLLTTTFTDPRERGRAFGVFGAIAGSGAAVGLLLGGVLTEYTSWRWCLYVNVFFAVVAIIGAVVLLPQSQPERTPHVRPARHPHDHPRPRRRRLRLLQRRDQRLGRPRHRREPRRRRRR